MPRNMVSGKPSSQSARGVDIPPTTRLASSGYLCSTCGNTYCKGNQEYGFCSCAIDVRPALWKCVWSCSRLSWIWSTSRNERQTVASKRPFGVPSVWVRFILARLNFDSGIVHLSWWMRLLIPFTTLSNKSNHMIIKDDVWQKFLPWLNNHIELKC
jgi:hypothetical protein